MVVAHADQQLGAVDAVRAQVNDRLLMEDEAVLAQSITNPVRPPEARYGRRLAVCSRPAVSTRRSRPASFASYMAMSASLTMSSAVASSDGIDRGEADARGEANGITFELDARVRANRVEELVRDGAGGVSSRAGEDQPELIATQTPENVGLPQPGPQDVRDAAQRRVTDGMAIGVVDVLEVIDVEKQQGRRALEAASERDRPRELGVERAAVEQPGQRVVRREMPQSLLQALALGDVSQNRGHGDHRPLGVRGSGSR